MVVLDKNVAYLGCIDPRHHRLDIEEIVDMGCTSITLTVNECDWQYYRAARKNVVKLAQDHGLKVYLDMHGFGIFASPLPCSSYPVERPESCQISSMGKGGKLSCPNDEGFKGWLNDQISAIIKELKPDGMFWDEPRFLISKEWPLEWACRCGNCQRSFKEERGYELPEKINEDVLDFRQSSLLGFLEGIMAHAKKEGRGKNIPCLMPWVRNGGQRSLSPGWYGVIDWEPFVRLPMLDVFSTDPYWIHHQAFEYFEANTVEAVKLPHKYGKRCQIWAQAVWIPSGKEREIKRTILRAAELGVDMVAVWSFRCEPGAHVLDYGGDKELAWTMVVEGYKQI